MREVCFLHDMKDAHPQGSVFSCRCTYIAPKFSDVAKDGPSQVKPNFWPPFWRIDEIVLEGRREGIRMRLMENTGMLPSDAIESSVITPHVTVPTTACTYVCPAHELPHDREYHLVRFRVKTGSAASTMQRLFWKN